MLIVTIPVASRGTVLLVNFGLSMRSGDLVGRSAERAGVFLPGPLGSAVGFVAAIGSTMLSWLVGAGVDSRIGLVLLTLTAIVVGAFTTLHGAIGAGAMCWSCYSGFVLNRFGLLSFDRGGGQALLVIALAAMSASAVAALARWARAVAADQASARALSAAQEPVPATSPDPPVSGDRPAGRRYGACGR
jgi:hypothetical protein